MESTKPILRKSFGDTAPKNKARSNRYEVDEEEEADADEVQLRAEETLD